MKQALRVWIAAVVAVSVISVSIMAAEYDFGTINYQGIIRDADGENVSGSYTITFRIWDAALGGSQWWSEEHTCNITDGTVCIVLGTKNSLADLDWSRQYWLELHIQGDDNPIPRIQLTSVPYSMNTKELQGYVPGNLSEQVPISNGVQNVNLNADKLDGADRAAFVEEGEPNTITSSMIVDDAVTFEDISDGTIRFSNIHQNGATSAGQVMMWNGSAWVIGNVESGVACGTVLDCTLGQPAFKAVQHGEGEALRLEHLNPNVYGPALYVSTQHRGTAGKFVVNLTSNENYAVYALTKGTGNAVYAESWGSDGVYGKSLAPEAAGVSGYSASEQGYGIAGWSDQGIAVYGNSPGWAGYFDGDVYVSGNLVGGKSTLKIDHPLDPENKYLVHSSVASPDMKNVYDGVVELDPKGEAIVELPEYFEALNKDFRYQLTCIGGYAPVYISQEIEANMFEIAGGQPGMRVSWQVTGIRKDAFAQANPIEVEVEKPANEQGLYIHPEAFGLGDEYGVDYKKYAAHRKHIGVE
ncbi:MAG: hypothetical protein ABII79_05520 [bacterium]